MNFLQNAQELCETHPDNVSALAQDNNKGADNDDDKSGSAPFKN